MTVCLVATANTCIYLYICTFYYQKSILFPYIYFYILKKIIGLKLWLKLVGSPNWFINLIYGYLAVAWGWDCFAKNAVYIICVSYEKLHTKISDSNLREMLNMYF